MLFIDTDMSVIYRIARINFDKFQRQRRLSEIKFSNTSFQDSVELRFFSLGGNSERGGHYRVPRGELHDLTIKNTKSQYFQGNISLLREKVCVWGGVFPKLLLEFNIG